MFFPFYLKKKLKKKKIKPNEKDNSYTPEKMEFVCGLKQFKEYKIEEAEQLLDCLNKLFTPLDG
jgi:hypothetical protein